MEINKGSKLYFFAAVTGALSTGLPFMVGIWFPFMWGVLGLTLVSFSIWVYLEKIMIKDFILNKQVHKGSFQLFTIVWALIIVVGLNFLASKYNKSLDITSDLTNTLSKESLKVLEGLNEDISLKVFYTDGANPNLKLSLKKLFYLYEKESSKVKSNFLNAKWEPSAAQYLTREDQVPIAIFVDSLNGKERVEEPISEETITTAILRLQSKEKNIIYFTSGHGERSLADEDIGGISELKTALNSRGLVTAPISLLNLKNGEMPPDLYALVIAGPVKAFSKLELDVLRAFLEDGGRLLLAIEPEFVDFFNPLFKSIGITFNPHYVLSVESPLPFVVLGTNYSLISEITKDFINAQVMFPGSSSITLDTKIASKNLKYEVLVSTSPYSIAANDKNMVQKIMRQIEDKVPLSLKKYDLGILIEGIAEGAPEHLHDGHNHGSQFKKGENFSFVGFADSDFFSNEYINNVYNKDLILNSIVYLTGKKDLITIRPNKAKATTIKITSMGLNIGALLSFFPFLIFGSLSLFFWYKKRSQ